MHISGDAKILNTALSVVGATTPAKALIPALQNVHVTADNTEGITFTTTDLDLWVDYRIPPGRLETFSREGRALLQYETLTKFFKSVKTTGSLLLTDSGGYKATGPYATINIPETPLEDFPDGPEVAATIGPFKRQPFTDLLALVVPSMTMEDSRYALGAVLLEIEKDELCLVATDGHRLSRATLKLPFTVEKSVSILIPKGAVKAIAKSKADEIWVGTTDAGTAHQWGVVQGDEVELYRFRVPDHQFPNYKLILKGLGTHECQVNIPELLPALQSIAGAYTKDDRMHNVHFILEGGDLRLRDSKSTVSSEVECGQHGDDIHIAFNVQYLIQLLRIRPRGTVTMRYKDADSQVLFTWGEFQGTTQQFEYIVMPVRI